MAALDDIKVATSTSGLSDDLIASLKKMIAMGLWSWIRSNQQLVLVRRKVLWITVSVRVSDLDVLFTALLGPDPLASTR